jgi:hypothetical protein
MTYEQAMQRLAGYANLPGSDDGDPGLGPLLTRWQRTGDRLDVQAICQGIVECIQSMVSAEQVRGPVPLSTPLARPPAYSVSCILVDLSRAVASDRDHRALLVAVPGGRHRGFVSRSAGQHALGRVALAPRGQERRMRK